MMDLCDKEDSSLSFFFTLLPGSGQAGRDQACPDPGTRNGTAQPCCFPTYVSQENVS
jgi:hypothetical protein